MWLSFVDAFTCLKKKWDIPRSRQLKPRLLAFVSLAWLYRSLRSGSQKSWETGLSPRTSSLLLLWTKALLNVVNAIEALNVPVVVCNAHRLNTVVCWMLGIAGSDKTCKNPVLEKKMKKLVACVGKFSHSAVNNSDLKTIQQFSPVFSKVYALIRRNDTR